MTTVASPWLGAAGSALAVVPAWAAGAAAAFAGLLLVIEYRRGGALGLVRAVPRFVLALAAVVAVVVLLEQNAGLDRAADRRALEARAQELAARVLAPGSPLACLAGDAGEEVETACEKAIFASPEVAAAAVAFVGARLSLLADAVASAGPDSIAAMPALAGMRRSLALDRYGIVAQVLATRDGCNAERCAAFALLGEVDVVKSNLKARVYDTYVGRYAAIWTSGEASAAPDRPTEPVATPGPQANAPVAGQPPQPVSSRYDFPSAASIPPVSIMAAEPPLPNAAIPNSSTPAAAPPVPQRRPQGPPAAQP